MDVKIKEAIESLKNDCQKMLDDNYKDNVNKPTLSISYGKKYAKLISKNQFSAGGSAWCFIDITNGDILKTASWNAPAKHARGNVLNDNRMKSVSPFGAVYLK